MPARIGVVTFPGTLDDQQALRAAAAVGAEPVALWHKDRDLHQVDAVVLPGGFSYGDYLRAGAIARFSPVMDTLIDAARGGLPVLGICNGFQVLCEAHLLEGAMIRNGDLHFINRDVTVRIENNRTAWTSDYEAGAEAVIPIKNVDGRFVADERTLDTLEAEGRVLARYLANPNGAARDIAGITNAAGNVVGLMPHPEYAIDELTGPAGFIENRRVPGTDGLPFFTSILKSLVSA
ncbi:phosphoribosylformylglycinamidine synthase subunit PurQ [Catenulispora pinisilvae]|uniref:phosphoribosylformylglycinamidine synthase subunit PurQ n=1 Tax=Catenulispora pinisilvae TaxID=2705253 RepID=UPI0018919B07|nr:phosphoribosylformylglycinamidine synthase subunit PurQ [Catenulispora pinisilvae]